MLRSKGTFEILEEPNAKFTWASSFSSRTVSRLRRREPDTGQALESSPSWAVEIVFIGINMNQDVLRAELDKTVTTDADDGNGPNPFAKVGQSVDAHAHTHGHGSHGSHD